MKISTIRFEPDFKAGLMDKYDCYYRGREYGPQSYLCDDYDENWVHLAVDDAYLVRCDYYAGHVEYYGVYTLEAIRESLSGSGRYQIFNCSCLVPECGGWDEDGTIVSHTAAFIDWELPEKQVKYRFNKEQYKSALRDLDKSLELISAYDSWTQAPGNSNDPLLWAISTNQNDMLRALLVGDDIASISEHDPEKFGPFESYAAHAKEVGNVEAFELISEKL